MLKIINKTPLPTPETIELKEALENLGVEVKLEAFDGFKHVDIEIAKAKLDIEVDGVYHLTNPKQILSDLNRSYYSHKDGFNTIHIPNEMVRKYLKEISEGLAEASKIKEQQINIHLS